MLSLPQCSRQTGGLRVLRAAAERQGLLLRPRRQGGGRGRPAAEGGGGAGQLRLLVSAGPAHPHGRHRPHRHAHPLAALQRRRGQGVCAAQVRGAFGGGGQMRREEEHRESGRQAQLLLAFFFVLFFVQKYLGVTARFTFMDLHTHHTLVLLCNKPT